LVQFILKVKVACELLVTEHSICIHIIVQTRDPQPEPLHFVTSNSVLLKSISQHSYWEYV